MAAKKFHIAGPDQLEKVARYAKETPNGLDKMARVWTATLRKDGKTRWDHAIYAVFSGDRAREAYVVRFTADDEILRCAELRYNLALNWCEQNLRPVQD